MSSQTKTVSPTTLALIVVAAIIVGSYIGAHLYYGCSNWLGACIVGTK